MSIPPGDTGEPRGPRFRMSGSGCLISIVASVLLTVVLNLALRSCS
ncbi:MAG TPA: hypothetical protein VNI56_00120 [Xanthomonadaceae bacterium]|nr:hypothetical protein [Xanthomonadaceae bacterium]